jgi:hypothetical protein
LASEYSVRTAPALGSVTSVKDSLSRVGDPGSRPTPRTGERIELLQRRGGILSWWRGTVSHSDELRSIVKLDCGRTASLRAGHDRYRVLMDE